MAWPVLVSTLQKERCLKHTTQLSQINQRKLQNDLKFICIEYIYIGIYIYNENEQVAAEKHLK